MKKVLLISIACIMFISGCGKEKIDNQSNPKNDDVYQVEINTEYINIRKSNDINSDIIGKVYKGEIYDVLEEDQKSDYKWIKIKTNNGLEGYIAGIKDYLIKHEVESFQEIIEEIKEPESTQQDTSVPKKQTDNNNQATFKEDIPKETAKYTFGDYKIYKISGINKSKFESWTGNTCKVSNLTINNITSESGKVVINYNIKYEVVDSLDSSKAASCLFSLIVNDKNGTQIWATSPTEDGAIQGVYHHQEIYLGDTREVNGVNVSFYSKETDFNISIN